MNRIQLHVERLVLEGIPLAPGGERALREALAFEMTRLLTEGGIGGARARGSVTWSLAVDARVSRDGRGSALGTDVARAAYQAIGKRP